MLTWTRRVGARPKRKFDNDPEAVNSLLSTFLPPFFGGFFVLAVLDYLLFFWFSSSLGARVKSQVEAFLSCTDFFDSIWPTFFNTISCELNESQNLNHSRSHTHTHTDRHVGRREVQPGKFNPGKSRQGWLYTYYNTFASNVVYLHTVSYVFLSWDLLEKEKEKKLFDRFYSRTHTQDFCVCQSRWLKMSFRLRYLYERFSEYEEWFSIKFVDE
jgi:hypothetical protein